MNSAHVRVFSSQDILCPDTEPLCITSSNSTFWVALSSGIIRGYSTHTTRSTFHKLYEFKSIWPQVIDMYYLPDLRRLVTLERRFIKSSAATVREEVEDILEGTTGATVKPQHHSDSSPSSTLSNNDSDGMIQQQVCRVYHLLWSNKECKTKIGVCTLPLGNQVSLISACSHSNAIQVCVNRIITVWAFPYVSQTASSGKNIAAATNHLSGVTVAPICILKLHTSWTVKCITIFQQFIGYGSDTDVRIVKLKYVDSDALKQEQEHTKSDADLCVFWGVSQCSVDTQNYVEVRFNTANYDLVPSPATSTYSPTNIPTSRKNDKAYDIVGETPNVDHPAFVNKKYIETCTNLLHKHFVQSETARSIHFIRNISQKKEFFAENAGMRCIISTSNKGYVYDISNPQLLSEFEFTGECIKSGVNSLFLFAITPAGMEIWSVLGSSRGCLLRFHPFIGLKSVCATNRKVVLLSKFSSKENVSIAAYYNQTTSETVILSDIRNVDKLSSNGKSKGSLLPIFSSWRKQPRSTTTETKRDVVEERVTYSYNIYVLDIVELCEIYEDMLEKAVDSEEVDQEKYLKLLKESHSLLQSKYYNLLLEEQKTQNPVSCLQLQLEIRNYTMLLKKSFGMLGDVYTKLESFDQAAACYAQSDKLLHKVFAKLDSKPQSLLLYLESVLFDNDKCSISQHNEIIGNKILNIYKTLAPHRFSTLILESCISNYSRQQAVATLEKIGGEILNLPNPIADLERILDSKLVEESDSEYDLDDRIPDEAFDLNPNSSVQADFTSNIDDDGENEDDELLAWWSDTRPKDTFALSLLLLEVNQVLRAVKLLSSLESSIIVDHCVNQTHLLFDGGITALGKVLRGYFPWCLLEILVRLVEATKFTSSPGPLNEQSVLDVKGILQGNITLRQAIELLESSEDSSSNNRLLCEMFATSVILTRDWSKSGNTSFYRELIVMLLAYYLEDLQGYSSNESKVDTPRSVKKLSDFQEWCLFFTYNFIDQRHHWLNDMSLEELTQSLTTSPETHISKDLIHKIISQLLEKNALQAVSDNIRSQGEHTGLSRLIYSLFNIQGLLCFIGGEHKVEHRFSNIVTKENSKFYNTNDEEESAFQGIRPTMSAPRKKFRLKLSEQCVSLYRDQLEHVSSLSCAGKVSVELLCLTALGNYERAFEILLQIRPKLSFTYTNYYCKHLQQWRHLTDRFVQLLKKNDAQNEEIVETYEKALWHLAKVFLPEDFLSLLPQNGNVDYFLPFINYCFSCQCSSSCFNAMVDIQQRQHL